jgi:CheY-like chemotaxis protein
LEQSVLQILFIQNDLETAASVEKLIGYIPDFRFHFISKRSGEEALEELEHNPDIRLIVTEYLLPGMNGFETTEVIRSRNENIPIIFLTDNRDMNLAVEAMKIGVTDYLLKEDLTSALFVQTLLNVVQQQTLREEVSELELRKNRLEAMQEIVVGITHEINEPLEKMKGIVARLVEKGPSEKGLKYIMLMKENVDRIGLKMEKLKNLKDEKTVPYIKDIKMIDLS